MNAMRSSALAAALVVFGGVVVAFVGPGGVSATSAPGWLAALFGEDAATRLVIVRSHLPWLVPAALVPWVTWATWRSLLDVPRWQRAVQAVTRLAVAAAAGLALSQPTLEAPALGKSIVLALDVSRSVDDAGVDAGAAAWKRARELVAADPSGMDPAQGTRLHGVTYAQSARVLAVDSEPARMAEGLGSDHAAAVRLAEALFDPGREHRLILLTDGRGSVAEREGLREAVQGLQARGAQVFVRRTSSGGGNETWIEGVFVPPELRVGETFDVVVDVGSTVARDLALTFEQDGEPSPLVPRLQARVAAGRTQLRATTRVTRPGVAAFRVRLAAADGGVLEGDASNDVADSVALVRGNPRVLHVGNDPSAALVRALRADRLDVEDVGPMELPEDAAGLAAYDLVVLSDVAARRVSASRQHALASWVEQAGGGLVMVGGEDSFGVGGWGGTVLEGVMPVRFEGERQREQPTLALALVIDKSGSMSSEDKLDLVKEAARATARTLDASDELGVIAFDSGPKVLVRLQPAANRIRIAGDIRRLTAGGGTHALPALREAFLQLTGSQALVKHVILLSDGQSPEAGISALVADMRDADITVSTVGVGAGAGKDLLMRIAEQGRGRFYFSQDGTDVPRIFSRETTEVTRNAVVERQIFAQVAKPAQALRGIDFARAPGLAGIVPVQPKPLAETLLRTQHGDALLVRGRHGLGRAAAFASDAKPRWAARWMGWAGFPKLWSQVARDVMRQGGGGSGGAEVQLRGAGPGRWRVVVRTEGDDTFANDLQGEVTIHEVGEQKGSEGPAAPLMLTAPGQYEAELAGLKVGAWLVTARLREPADPRAVVERVERVVVPHAQELVPAAPGDDLRAALAALSADGLSEGPIDDLVSRPASDHGHRRSRPLWREVVAFLFLPLFLLDLAARRVQFGGRPRGSL